MSDKDFRVKNGLTVADSIGVGTDTPSVSIDASQKTDAVSLPSGTTSQRPTTANGAIRFNSEIDEFEGFSTSKGWAIITTANSSIDASFLNGHNGAFYQNAANMTGTIPAGHFNATSHGNLAGGALHSAATTAANGFMSAADKTRIDAMPNGVDTLAYRGTIPGSTDLNTYTSVGIYIQNSSVNASSGTNYPIGQAGQLVVWNFSTTFIGQSYYVYGGLQPNLYIRQYYNDTWSAWSSVWNNVNLTDSVVLDKIKNVDGTGSGLDSDLLDGQQGTYYNNLANSTGTIPDGNLPSRLNYGPGITDCNTATQSGFYFVSSTATNSPVATFGYLVVMQLDAAGRCKQVWYTYNGVQIFWRDMATVGNWTAWKESTSDKATLDSRYVGVGDYTAADVKAKILTIDGAGSTIDADLLDGQHGAYYNNLANATGTIPEASMPARLALTASTIAAATITDWNDATSAGWYRGNGATNAPPSSIVATASWLVGRVECYTSTYLIQTVWPASAAVSAADTRTAMRVCSNGTWSGWFKLMLSQTENDARYAQTGANVSFGTITAVGDVTSPALVSPSAAVIVSPAGAGAVYLRPNGRNNATGQTTINNNGVVTLGGALTGGTTGTFSGAVTAGSITSTGAVYTSGSMISNATDLYLRAQGGGVHLRPNDTATNEIVATAAGQLTLPANPTANMSAATKGYVDTAIAGIPFTKEYISAPQTIVRGGDLALSHGLGVKPKLVQMSLVCQTAEYGFAVGDEILVDTNSNSSAGTSSFSNVLITATQIKFHWAGANSDNYVTARLDNTSVQVLTVANWKIIVRAWA